MTKLKPIHKSHKMGQWKPAVVTIINTSRFGEIRECVECGAEHVRSVCGEDWHDELITKCEGLLDDY